MRYLSTAKIAAVTINTGAAQPVRFIVPVELAVIVFWFLASRSARLAGLLVFAGWQRIRRLDPVAMSMALALVAVVAGLLVSGLLVLAFDSPVAYLPAFASALGALVRCLEMGWQEVRAYGSC